MPTTIQSDHESQAEIRSFMGLGGGGELLDLVSSIYDDFQKDKPWDRTVKLLRKHLGAAWVALMLRPATTSRPAQVVTAGGAVSLPSESPYTNVNDIPPGGIFREVEADCVNVLEAPGVRGSQHIIGADVVVRPAFRLRLRIGRNRRAGAFADHEMRLVQALLPHFARAFQSYDDAVAREAEAEVLRGAVDSLCLGVIILGESGDILQANPCAQQTLQLRRHIGVSKGTVHCSKPSDDKRLWAAIRLAQSRRLDPVRPASIAVCASRDEHDAWLSMLVRPIVPAPFSPGAKAAAVAIFFRRSDQQRNFSPDTIRDVFGLTRTESALTLEIAEGATMDEAAAALNIRRNTARTHLRSIFSKIGVRRQSELLRIVLNSVATMV